MNKYIKNHLAWILSLDTYMYALAFPVIMWVINKERSIALYVLPSTIMCLFGGTLNAFITGRKSMELLYNKYFNFITIMDAVIWITYFMIWILGWVPDSWYPVASAVMHVTTVQLSRAIREELRNRIFPNSTDKTEFQQACHTATDVLEAIAGITLIVVGLKSFNIARVILMLAMVIDNGIILVIHSRFESGKKI